MKYVGRFQAAQREAREAGRGLWGDAPSPAQDPLLGPQGDEEAAKAPIPPAPPEAATTVYVTRTGSKYHRDGCQYLRRSRIPVTLKEALARGCTACSRCRP